MNTYHKLPNPAQYYPNVIKFPHRYANKIESCVEPISRCGNIINSCNKRDSPWLGFVPSCAYPGSRCSWSTQCNKYNNPRIGCQTYDYHGPMNHTQYTQCNKFAPPKCEILTYPRESKLWDRNYNDRLDNNCNRLKGCNLRRHIIYGTY